MRRFTKPFLALAAVGCAALAAVVSPASGASQSDTSATSSSPRVFYIVYGSSWTLFGEPDDGSSGDPNGPAFNPDDTSGADSSDDYDDPSQEALASIPDTDWGRYNLLLTAGLASGTSDYAQAMGDLELPYMFAGREQWARNLAGVGVAGEERLWNVTMESIMRDDNARMLLLGRAAETAVRGLSGADQLAYWRSLVPSWAPRVRGELAKKGIPFSVELLADPDLNLSDPSKPLFPKGLAPLSLFSLGVLQGGENTFLRSLSAEELMLEVWPAYYRFYHRAAGAPVPADLRAGFTFGSPVLQSDGTYLRSPMMQADIYRRWARYGYPGIVSGDAAKSAAKLAAAIDDETRFRGDYALFAPSQTSPDVISRYQILANGG